MHGQGENSFIHTYIHTYIYIYNINVDLNPKHINNFSEGNK